MKRIWVLEFLHEGTWYLEEDRFWSDETKAKEYQLVCGPKYRVVAYVPIAEGQNNG